MSSPATGSIFKYKSRHLMCIANKVQTEFQLLLKICILKY